MSAIAPLDIIVPISIDVDHPTVESVIHSILYQYHEYGIKRFMLACPCKGWRSVGFPPLSFFQDRAEFFVKVRDAVKPHGIDCGWWLTTTLKSGPSDEWEQLTQDDGQIVPNASCPLNPVFRDRMAKSCALFIKIAKPSFMITEDDYSLTAASVFHHGCFCKYHLEEFARRTGKPYTRQEIASFLGEEQRDTPEGIRIRKVWESVHRDALVLFASAIRAEVDKENPEVPMGTMQSGSWDSDGNPTDAVSRALGGKNHTPFSRLTGAFYAGEEIQNIPVRLFHAIYSRQHLADDFRCYMECDTYPGTRFYHSGASMRSIMATVFSHGFVGATFQIQAIVDNPDEEKAYGFMYAEEHLRLEAIHQAAAHCRTKGVQLVYDPFWQEQPAWVRPVSHFGIPYITTDSPIVFLSGQQPAHMSDEELMALFRKKGLFLDGDAAKIISDRGFSKYIGVKVGESAIQGMERYDLGGRECIEPGFVPECTGRRMTRSDMWFPKGNGANYSLEVMEPNCEVITKVKTFQDRVLTVGMTRFQNELGGRVVVTGTSVVNNFGQNLFNYRKQQLIQEQIVWCSDEFAFMDKYMPRVFLIMNEAKNPGAAGFRAMLTMTNMNPDPVKPAIHLPPALRSCTGVLRLNAKGKWLPTEFSRTDTGIKLSWDMAFARPEVLLLCD